MGDGVKGPSSEYTVYVRTGDRLNAGTDANVKIRLHDEKGNVSDDICLDNFFSNDFERGAFDQFDVSILCPPFHIYRGRFCWICAD